MAFETYDPSRVSFVYCGIIVTGYMDGTFIDIEREAPSFTKHVGALGDVTRTRNLDRTGKITLTLMAQAPSNSELADLLLADENGANSFGPLQVIDSSGDLVVHATEAWISKVPKAERAKEAGSVQWMFECADMEIFVGGNT